MHKRTTFKSSQIAQHAKCSKSPKELNEKNHKMPKCPEGKSSQKIPQKCKDAPQPKCTTYKVSPNIYFFKCTKSQNSPNTIKNIIK